MQRRTFKFIAGYFVLLLASLLYFKDDRAPTRKSHQANQSSPQRTVASDDSTSKPAAKVDSPSAKLLIDSADALPTQPEPLVEEVKDSVIKSMSNGRSAKEIFARTGVTLKRAREVTIEKSVFNQLKAGSNVNLTFHLFQNEVAELAIKVTKSPGPSGLTLSGVVKNDPSQLVSLSYIGGNLVGTLFFKNQPYQIQSSERKTSYVIAIDTTRIPKSDGEAAVVNLLKEKRIPANPSKNLKVQSLAAPVTAGAAAPLRPKILFLYTRKARELAGSSAAIQAEIQNEIAITNESFATSGTGVTLDIVAMVETPTNEDPTNQDYDLFRLGDAGDGFFDEVTQLRKDYDADMVHLVTGGFTNSCGIAYLGSSDAYNMPVQTYGVSARNCSYKYTIAHEIGHNFGADHDPANAGAQSSAFARGYIDLAAPVFKDIMAYETGCPNFTCAFPKLYSNTVAQYMGRATGNANQDNARRIIESAPFVESSTSTYQRVYPGISIRPPNTSVTYTVDVPTDVPVQSIQWRKYTPASGVFADIPGANSPTYTTVVGPQNEFAVFYVLFTVSGGFRISYNAQLVSRAQRDFTAEFQTSRLDLIEGRPLDQVVNIQSTPGKPVSIRWQLNGVDVPGAVSPSILFNVPRNLNTISVIVSNASGSLTMSRPVTVDQLPTISGVPPTLNVTVGGRITVSPTVETSRSTASYLWLLNGSSTSIQTRTLDIGPVTAANAGSYRLQVTSAAGTVQSNNMVVSVSDQPITITSQPSSRAVVDGGSTTFAVLATGTNITYNWRFNGTSLNAPSIPTLTLNNIQSSQAGNYSVMLTNSASSVVSANAALTIFVAPTIQSQPANVMTVEGGSANFSVIANGNPGPTYQWTFKGADITGATNATLSLANINRAQAGAYAVKVKNSVATVMSTPATLLVQYAPTIATQPKNVTVKETMPAVFTVVATPGVPDATVYQWKKGGVNISGATAASYTIANAARTDRGSYSVIVGNTIGAVESNPVTLDVQYAPMITTQPMTIAGAVGANAGFNVVVDSNPAATYQWKHTNPITGVLADVGGATAAILNFAPLTYSVRGEYSVIATNTIGSIESNKVQVTLPSTDRGPAGVDVLDLTNLKVDRTGGFE